MVAVLQPLKHHKTIPIDRAVVLVGRGEDCDVVISGSKKISRKHCCLVQFDQSFLIRDLGSTNGVWINGRRVDRESEMEEGDRVAIGDVQFRFFPQGVRPSAGNLSDRQPQSAAPNAAEQPDSDIEIIAPVSLDSDSDVENAIEIVEDDLLEDDLISDENDDDDDLLDVNDAVVVTDTPRSDLPPQPIATGKGRPFPARNQSEPVINLDDSFADEDFEDIVVFDDD